MTSIYRGPQTTTPGTAIPFQPQGATQTGRRPVLGAPGSTPQTGQPQTGGVPGMTTFGANNNLINTQINPTASGMTNWAAGNTQSAGDAYRNFQFGQFQGLQPLNLGAQAGMLQGANAQMQGLGYNFGRANAQYGQAQNTLAGAASQANAALTGLQGLGIGAFSGGGANTADFSKAENLWTQAQNTIGSPFDYASDTGAARAMVVPALERAMTGPERNDLAAESLALLEERSQRGFTDAMRNTAEAQAAMGRRGSGQATRALNDVTNRREQELAWARRDLANEAASRTLEDRAARTQLAMGVTQGLGGEDRSKQDARNAQAAAIAELGKAQADAAQFNAGQQESAAQRAAQGSQFGASFQRGVAGDLFGIGESQARFGLDVGDRFGEQELARVGLGERQAGFQRGIGNDLAGFARDEWQSAFDERNAGRQDEYNQGDWARGQFTDWGNFLRQSQGEDRMNRGEMRDERGWQYGLSQDAIDDEYRRSGFEESLRGNRFNRGLATANIGFGAPSPAGAYGAQAGQFGQQAQGGFDATAMMMSMLPFLQGRGGGTRRGGAGSGGGGQVPVMPWMNF